MITNKPQDSEAIVEVRDGPMGQKLLVASPLFSRFLDDLVRTANETGDDPIAPQNTVDSKIRVLKGDIFSQLNAALQENSELKARLSKLESITNNLNEKLNNLEQVAWR
jgi:hypothetical protein